MSKERITVQGLGELVKNLREFADDLKGNPLRDASRAMGEIVRDSAVAKAPLGETGRLMNAIKMRLLSQKGRDAALKRGDSQEIYDVYVRMGQGRDDEKGAYYWWMVENGHDIKASRNGPVLGHVPAQPFMRPAFYENEIRLPDAFADKLRPAIEKAAKKRAERMRVK